MNVTEHHNKEAPRIVREIVHGPLQAGGDLKSVLVLLESVITGVCLATIKLGGDEPVLDKVMEGAKARLAEARLGNIKTGGRA